MAQNYAEFAQLLQGHLNRLDRSQGWLARELDCDPAQINRWLSDFHRPGNRKRILEMERPLGLSREQLNALLVAANYPAQYPTLVKAKPAEDKLPDPLMNFENELSIFEKIASGEDTETQIVVIHGEGGTGKSRLLTEYQRIATEQHLNFLPIYLEQQISIDECLYLIACEFGLHNCAYYSNFRTSVRPEPWTRQREEEWQSSLTHYFFKDLHQNRDLNRLAIYFDSYEKADPALKYWLSRVFLPVTLNQIQIVVVIAGQEKIEAHSNRKGYRHFHLDGLSLEWFFWYLNKCNIPHERSVIAEIHKVLRGRPKLFVDYVRTELVSAGVK